MAFCLTLTFLLTGNSINCIWCVEFRLIVLLSVTFYAHLEKGGILFCNCRSVGLSVCRPSIVRSLLLTPSLDQYKTWCRGCPKWVDDPYWFQVTWSKVKVKPHFSAHYVVRSISFDPLTWSIPNLVKGCKFWPTLGSHGLYFPLSFGLNSDFYENQNKTFSTHLRYMICWKIANTILNTNQSILFSQSEIIRSVLKLGWHRSTSL